MRKFEDSFANLEEIKYTRSQYVRKLKVLNEMMWNYDQLSSKASKAKSILISNQVHWEKKSVREKARLERMSQELEKIVSKQSLERKSAGIQKASKVKRSVQQVKPHWVHKSKSRYPKCRHVVDKCCSRHYSVPHTFENCTPFQPKDVFLNPPSYLKE